VTADELARFRANRTCDRAPTNTLREAVLEQFAVEIRIESRRVLWPTVRLPSVGVRELSPVVDPTAQHPNRGAEFEGRPLDLVPPS
jgi:hypothetical protein